MNLIELRRKLDAIPIDAAQLRLIGNNQVSNFLPFKDAVNRLATIPPLTRLAQEVQANQLFQMLADQFQTDPNNLAAIRQRADALFGAATSLIQILHDTVPKVPPETVIITLPSGRDLASTTEFLELFDKSLTPLVIEPSVEGKVEVIHWESGSLLVFVFLGTMSAVTLIARALKAAAIAYQEIQKGRATAQHVQILKEHVREERIKNDLADVIADAQKTRIRAVVDREARAVELEIFSDNQNERLERIKHSVRTLAELFEQGATVSPALDMPAEEQQKFPDVNHLLTVAPPIKQLPESKEGETEESSPTTSPPSESNTS